MKAIEDECHPLGENESCLAINFTFLTFLNFRSEAWHQTRAHHDRQAATCSILCLDSTNTTVRALKINKKITEMLVFLWLLRKSTAISAFIQHTKFSAAPPNVNRPRRTRFHFVSGVRFEAPMNANSKETSFVGPLTKRTLNSHHTPVRPGFVRAVQKGSCSVVAYHVTPLFAVHSGAIHTQSGESIQYMASYVQGCCYNMINSDADSSPNKIFMLICFQA